MPGRITDGLVVLRFVQQGLYSSYLHSGWSCSGISPRRLDHTRTPGAPQVLKACHVPVVTYSMSNPRADVYAEDVKLTVWETEVSGVGEGGWAAQDACRPPQDAAG
jgi:hypothetical protein